jgi:hypothetical protein
MILETICIIHCDMGSYDREFINATIQNLLQSDSAGTMSESGMVTVKIKTLSLAVRVARIWARDFNLKLDANSFLTQLRYYFAVRSLRL